MKKMLFTLVTAGLLASACKKEKNAPRVEIISISLLNYNMEANNEHSVTWFAKRYFTNYSMEDIRKNIFLQGDVLMGFYNNNLNYGLYSPASYPVEYGQQDWNKLNTTTFKITKIKVQALLQKETIDADYIDQAWAEGVDSGTQLHSPHTGKVYAFEAENGKVRGLIRITELFNPNPGPQGLAMKLWIKH